MSSVYQKPNLESEGSESESVTGNVAKISTTTVAEELVKPYNREDSPTIDGTPLGPLLAIPEHKEFVVINENPKVETPTDQGEIDKNPVDSEINASGLANPSTNAEGLNELHSVSDNLQLPGEESNTVDTPQRCDGCGFSRGNGVFPDHEMPPCVCGGSLAMQGHFEAVFARVGDVANGFTNLHYRLDELNQHYRRCDELADIYINTTVTVSNNLRNIENRLSEYRAEESEMARLRRDNEDLSRRIHEAENEVYESQVQVLNGRVRIMKKRDSLRKKATSAYIKLGGILALIKNTYKLDAMNTETQQRILNRLFDEDPEFCPELGAIENYHNYETLTSEMEPERINRAGRGKPSPGFCAIM